MSPGDLDHHPLFERWTDPVSGVVSHLLRERVCHAHCNADRSLWCADESPYKWARQPCQVLFFHRASGRVVPIVSAMPAPQANRSWYHIDPHPQFSPDGEWISYTTTVRGSVDLALCAVSQLLP